MKLRELLAARGIHYLVTRFGTSRIRSMAFDEKYRRGDWQYHEGKGSELQTIVRQYLRCGDLLILGCGGASILEGWEEAGLNSALGVDLSEEAIRLASHYASEKVTFQKADMVEFACPRSYDVILFSESLYYVPGAVREHLLRRLSDHLKPAGVFVVTFAQAERYLDALEMIRHNFEMIADRAFVGSSRFLMVFRPCARHE